MKILRPFAVYFLCLLSSCSTGQGDKDKYSQSSNSLRINIGEDPSSLDPRRTRSLCDRTLMNMLFEGLTRINKEEKAEPALAQVIEVSSDLTSYTFYLREANWSNGKAVKASDFAYAWKKILDPNFVSDTAFQLYPIKNAKEIKSSQMPVETLGVEVIDEKTLKVHLEQPTPYFLELTAFPAFFPICEEEDKANPLWAEKASTAIACGPFRLEKWKHSDELRVIKNEHYWDAASVHLKDIVMCMVKEDTELKMFEKKELDWVGSPLSTIPIDAIDCLLNAKSLQSKPMLGTYFFRINTSKGIFRNVNIRKALALAIDRSSIVDNVLQGNQRPATGLVPPTMGLQKTPYFQDHDVQEAKSLWEKGLFELNLSKEDLSKITVIFPAGEKSHLIAQAVQEQWREAFGVNIQIQSLERKVYFDTLSKQNYEIAAGSWIADFNDPIAFLEVFKYKTSSTNNTSWSNDKYANLLDQSSAIGDPDHRRVLLSESEDLLIQEMPIIPVFYYNMLFASHPHVKEMVLSSMGSLDFKWVHLENAK